VDVDLDEKEKMALIAREIKKGLWEIIWGANVSSS